MKKLSTILIFVTLAFIQSASSQNCMGGFGYQYTDGAQKTISFFDYSRSSLNWVKEYVHWNFGDGTLDTGMYNVHTFPDTLIYNVVRESKYVEPGNPLNFCIKTDSMLVDISQAPLYINPRYKIKAKWLNGLTYGLSSYHYGLVEDLCEIVVNNGFNIYVQPDVPMNGIYTTNQDFSTYTLPSVGDYSFTLRISYPMYGEATCGVFIYGDSIPQTPTDCHASFFMMPDSIDCNSWTLYNYSTGSNLSYFWDFGDGTTSVEQNPTHYFDSTALYTICLTVSNGSCTNTSCEKTFGDSLRIGDGMRKLMVVNALGISENSLTNFNLNVFPNPAENIINIEMDKIFDNVCIQIYDQLGRENIKQIISPNNKSTVINIQDLNAGIYFIKLSDKNGNILGAEKFIKK